MDRNDYIFTSLLRAIFLTIVVASLIAAAVLPGWAQNAVPPTARQAVSMPAYAARLAHPAQSHTPGNSPALLPIRRMSPQDAVIYENGPVNGNTDAWTINSGFAVTNSVVAYGGTTAVEFYAWLFPGDIITSVEVDFGTQPLGSDIFRGTVSLTQSNCQTNQFGYNVCFESGAMTNGPVLGGAPWLTLQNANVPNGDPVYWDENSGAGCQSTGCPSQAVDNELGTIPSEAFDVLGDHVRCGTSDLSWKQVGKALAQSFQVIYNFLGGEDGAQPQGLTLDRGGNFYGTTVTGGNTGGQCYGSGCGTVFRLAHRDSGWALQTLYRFSGPDGAEPSSRVIFGPDGKLYGVTVGGGGSDGQGDGTVFSLQPPVHACTTALCSWTATVLHRFSYAGSDDHRAGSCSLQKDQFAQQALRPADNWEGVNPLGDVVFDEAGNLYGTTQWGTSGGNCGCGFACGLVYQLTPSGGGWQENVLYRFQGGDDGGNPSSGVILDHTGNLYGTTTSMGLGGGTVFRLTPHGLDVLHSFARYDRYGSRPVGGLLHDQTGNLYGTTALGGAGCGGCGCGTAFEMINSDTFSSLYTFTSPTSWWPQGPSSSLVMDEAGNMYGTTVGDGAYGYGSVFELSPTVGGWTYTDLYDFTGGADGSGPSVLTMDASGNLWGTTVAGGAAGHGVIFEVTP